MSRLKTLEDKVRAVLERDPKARDDDRILTLDVWTNLYGINPWSPVSEVLRNKDLPSQESLGRVRRKIQEKDVTLRGVEREAIRMRAQEDYIDYALDKSTK